MIIICGYGCGNIAIFPPKKGMKKWCCSESLNKCPAIVEKRKYAANYKRKPLSDEHKILLSKRKKESWENNESVYNTKLFRNKMSINAKKLWKDNTYRSNQLSSRVGLKRKSKFKYEQSKRFMGHIGYNKRTISKIKKKYPLFSKIEEMRYNPDKPGEKEIQVHCKNHKCRNSKENGGWFTPTSSQLYGRISAIENPIKFEEQHLYCSDECKQECLLYNLKGDLYKNDKIIYTNEEYNIWRNEVLKRSEYKCEYCGNNATHCHHIKPQKLEPFFSLDPDYGIACCEKCHYEKGHKDECSTGNLANILC